MEVVTLEIEQCARRPEADFDLRMAPREFAQPRQQPALQELVGHAQVEHAADPLAAQALDRPAQLVETAPHAGKQLGPLLRQCHRPRVTAEQGHADIGLERLDLRADRGGGHAQFLRRGGEAEVGCHRFKYAQCVQGDAVRGGCHPWPSSKMTVNNTDERPSNQG
jgi:hypothetical protein